MNLDNLTPEQREKAKGCTNTEQLIELAESEGLELTDDQLDAIAGGSSWNCDVDDGGYY